MPAAEIGEDMTTEPSLVRVEWFRREPGGGTLFVKPVDEEQVTELSVVGVEATET